MRPTLCFLPFVLCLFLPGRAAADEPQKPAPMKAEQPKVDPINPDRPGIADGSTVIGAGRFQIETGIFRQFQSEGGSDQRALFIPTLLRFGLTDAWELRIESNTY